MSFKRVLILVLRSSWLIKKDFHKVNNLISTSIYPLFRFQGTIRFNMVLIFIAVFLLLAGSTKPAKKCKLSCLVTYIHNCFYT